MTHWKSVGFLGLGRFFNGRHDFEIDMNGSIYGIDAEYMLQWNFYVIRNQAEKSGGLKPIQGRRVVRKGTVSRRKETC